MINCFPSFVNNIPCSNLNGLPISQKMVVIFEHPANGLDFILEIYDEVYQEQQDDQLYLLNEFISLVKQKKAGQEINVNANPQNYLEDPGVFSFLM